MTGSTRPMLVGTCYFVLSACLGTGQVLFQVDTNRSSVEIQLTVQGVSDTDISPLGGRIMMALDDSRQPTRIALQDFDVSATQDYDLALDYGFAGQITAQIGGLRVYHTDPGPPRPYSPITDGAYALTNVTCQTSGLAPYEASGLVCGLLENEGHLCSGTIDLSTLGESTIEEFSGTLRVTNRTITLTVHFAFSTPINFGSMRGTAVINAAAVEPRLEQVLNLGNPNEIVALFSRPMSAATALDAANYGLSGGLVTTGPLSFDTVNPYAVLIPTSDQTFGATYNVIVSDVEDDEGHVLSPNPTTKSFVHAAGGYAANFDAVPAGMTLYGNAAADDGVLKLTTAVENMQGFAVINPYPFAQTVSQFTVRFDLLIGGGTAIPGDGLSFNVSDSGMTPAMAEEGAASGLAINFDTYNNGGGEAPAFEVKWNGSIIGRPVFQQPSRGAILDLVPVTIRMDPDGTLDLTYDGNQIFADLQTPYTPLASPYWLMGARTGLFNDNHWLDNLIILPFSPGPPVLVTRPAANISAAEGDTINLAIRLGETTPPAVQWYRNGMAIPGATGFTYSFRAYINDDGVTYSADVVNGFGRETTSTVMHITPDTTAPMLANAAGDDTWWHATLTFSEAVNLDDASDSFNYAADSGLSILDAVMVNDRTVRLTTSMQTEGVVYTITVNNIKDLSLAQNEIARNSTIAFTAWIYSCGFVLREIYSGVGGGVLVSDLTNNPAYPGAPTTADVHQLLEGPVDAYDNYGIRIRGFITPNVSGDHNFWISADDQAHFWLSSDANPANMQLVCFEPAWNGSRQYKVPDRRGVPPENASTTFFPGGFPLTAGQRYYFEALMKEGDGNDNVSVAWQEPGGPEPENGSTPIGGNNVCILANPDTGANITISQEPRSMDIVINQVVPLRVVANNDQGAPQSYQWLLDGVAVAGNNTDTLLLTYTDVRLAGTTVTVQARVTVPGRTVETTPAVLTIRIDDVPPVPVSVMAGADLLSVTIEFDGLMDEVTATDPFHYLIDDGVHAPLLLGFGTLGSDLTTVTLPLDPTTPLLEFTTYTVEITSVQDAAFNTIDPDPYSVQFLTPVIFCSVPFQFEAYPSGPSADVNTLLTHPSFPGSPDEVLPLNAFDTRAEYTADHRDNYGGRVRGLWLPPVTGNYDFFMHNDDGALLFINPNGIQEAGKVLICELNPRCCQGWPAISSIGRFLHGIPLQAGQPYYLEGVFQEQGGDDYIRVAARLHGSSDTLVSIPASQFEPAVLQPGQFGTVTITQQPMDVTVEENHQACFLVEGTSTLGDPTCYRWFKNDVLIPLADGPMLCAFFGLGDDGARIRAEVAIPGYIARSDAAILTVNRDTAVPQLVSASATLNLDQVVLIFSERMMQDTAESAYNYELSDGMRVLLVDSAQLAADKTTVTLTLNPTTPLVENTVYTLTVVGPIVDLASNEVELGSSVTFRQCARLPVPTILPGCTVAGGTFTFSFTGVAGHAHVVEASTNLADWMPLQTNWLPMCSIPVSLPTDTPYKFFRIKAQ